MAGSLLLLLAVTQFGPITPRYVSVSLSAIVVMIHFVFIVIIGWLDLTVFANDYIQFVFVKANGCWVVWTVDQTQFHYFVI